MTLQKALELHASLRGRSPAIWGDENGCRVTTPRPRFRPHVGHCWHARGHGLNFCFQLLDAEGKSAATVCLVDNVVTRFDAMPELTRRHDALITLARKWQRKSTPQQF